MAIERTAKSAIVAKLVVAMLLLLGGPAAQSRAAGILECPEIGAGHVPDLIGGTTAAWFVNAASRVDLVNEVNGAINRLQIADPGISLTEVQNVLIAAYCRVVADASGLTVSDKWRRIRQFDRIVEQQIAADALPAGSLIVANVPLPPAVFGALRSQAAAVHLTTAQFMADILARAAGR
jgi:hypothetical protein